MDEVRNDEVNHDDGVQELLQPRFQRRRKCRGGAPKTIGSIVERMDAEVLFLAAAVAMLISMLTHDGLLLEATSVLLITSLAPFATRSQASTVRRAPWTVDSFDDQHFTEFFRFRKEHVPRIMSALKWPKRFVTPQRRVFTGEEGFLFMCWRLAYPHRYVDATRLFPASAASLCELFQACVEFMDDHHASFLLSGMTKWSDRIPLYFKAIRDKVGPCYAQNVAFFIDGTKRAMCKPSFGQGVNYDGKNREHNQGFIAAVAPDGLLSVCLGPFDGSRHDSYCYFKSGLRDMMISLSEKVNFIVKTYGDPEFGRSTYNETGHRGERTREENNYNLANNAARVAVEWDFGKVISLWKFLDFRSSLKVFVTPVGKLYRVAVLLTNIHCSLYGNQVTSYFALKPPALEEYLVMREDDDAV